MKKILKKISVVFILGVMILNAGCSKQINTQESFNTVESEEEYVSFEKAIELSDCAVNAEYITYIDNGDYVEYEFKVNNVLYGDVPDSNIYLFSMKGTAHVEEIESTYDIGDNKYTVGDEYILVMEKNSSLFYDHDRYMLIGEMIIPVDNTNESVMYDQPIKTESKAILNSSTNIVKYIQDIKKSDANTESSDELSYTKSNDMKTMISEADYVLELTVESLEVEGLVHNGNTYSCSSITVLKGDSLVKDEAGKILVTLLKDSVEIGNKYIVMVNKVDENSTIYTQVAEKSVIPVGDVAATGEVTSIIEE